jgi:hypothetical protein
LIQTTWKLQADALRNSFRTQDAALKADGRYSDPVRKVLRCRLILDTQKRLAALRLQHAGMVAAQGREMERAVFGHPDDPESYRLALDAVAQLDTPEKLSRRLRLAEKTGDEVTAAAIMAVASGRGSHGAAVVAQYLERRPDKTELYRRLREHEDQSAATFEDRLLDPFRVVTPGDLGVRHDNGDLERMAATVVQTAPQLVT